MKTSLIIAAVACLGLAACQQQTSEAPKEEKTSEISAPAEHAEHAASNAEHPMANPEQSPTQTEQPTTPALPGTSYYDNSQNQNLAEQANPAIDTQQQTAAQTQADTQEND